MKTRARIAIAVALTFSALWVADAHAYIILNGMVPVVRAGIVVLQPHKQSGTTDTLNLKFTGPERKRRISLCTEFLHWPTHQSLRDAYFLCRQGARRRGAPCGRAGECLREQRFGCGAGHQSTGSLFSDDSNRQELSCAWPDVGRTGPSVRRRPGA